MKKRRFFGVIFFIFSFVFLGFFRFVFGHKVVFNPEERKINFDDYYKNIKSSKLFYKIFCKSNFNFNYKEGSFLPASLVLYDKVDRIFEILKRDEQIKEYFNREYESNRNEEKYTNEDILKRYIVGDVLAVRDEEWAKTSGKKYKDSFESVAFDMPLEIFERINKIFAENEDIRKIVNDRDLDDEKFNSMKQKATAYCRKYIECLEKDNESRNKMTREQKKDVLKKYKWKDYVKCARNFFYIDRNLYLQILQMKRETISDKIIPIIEEIGGDPSEYKKELDEIEKEIKAIEENSNGEVMNRFNAWQNDVLDSIYIIQNKTPNEIELDKEEEDWIGVTDAGTKRIFELEKPIVQKRISEIDSLKKEDVENIYKTCRFGVKKEDGNFVESFLQIAKLPGRFEME